MGRTSTVGVLGGGALTFIAVVGAAAQSNPGQPFQALWSAISDLRADIAAIELLPGPPGAPGEAGPAGIGAHRVVDTDGQIVGVLIGATGALRRIGDAWFVLTVSREGFESPSLIIFYDQSACAGNPYLATGPVPNPLAYALTIRGSVGLYATDPIARGVMASRKEFGPTEDPFSDQGRCISGNVSGTFGPLATLSAPVVNVVPPFHIE